MTVIDHPTRNRRPDGTEQRVVQVPDPAPGAAASGLTVAESGGVPGTVEVRAWWDPGLAERGFSTRSSYAERFWLGVLGPTALFLVRRLGRGLDEHPAGFRMDLSDTARALGLGGGTGGQSPIVRTIDRCCVFNVMRRTGPVQLEVRTHLPVLTRRQLERLPLSIRRSHDAFLAHPSNGGRAGDPGPGAA